MPRSNRTTAGDPRFVPWAVAGFLLLAIWLIYGQTLDHGLLDYDDNGFVTDNPQVTAGLTALGIRWAWTRGPYGEWYPLSTTSHMLDCQLFGLNAWGHQLANVLYHAAASLALLLDWWRMSGELLPSAFVATAFAVHPQHVESVAWIAERREVLSGLFFMLTLGAYLGVTYLGQFLFPVGLASHYPLTPGGPPAWKAAAAVASLGNRSRQSHGARETRQNPGPRQQTDALNRGEKNPPAPHTRLVWRRSRRLAW